MANRSRDHFPAYLLGFNLFKKQECDQKAASQFSLRNRFDLCCGYYADRRTSHGLLLSPHDSTYNFDDDQRATLGNRYTKFILSHKPFI